MVHGVLCVLFVFYQGSYKCYIFGLSVFGLSVHSSSISACAYVFFYISQCCEINGAVRVFEDINATGIMRNRQA